MLTMETWRIREVAELEAVVAAVEEKALPKETGATVLALRGDLGAGKTTFTQTLARTLGITEPVTSPTFVIMKSYELADQAFETLIHIDAYRVASDEELTVLGFARFLETPRTLIVIEWAEKVAALLPSDTKNLTLAIECDARVVTLA